MELLVDGRVCELASLAQVNRDWHSDRLCSPEAWREGWSLELELPRGPVNDALFHYAFTPHAAERFNHTLHRAELRHRGATLHRGTVRLLQSTGSSVERCYRVELRGGAAAWAKVAATTPLRELPIEVALPLLPSQIIASWTGATPVRMLPILYDRYESHQAASSSLQAERILSVDDYHPFLQLYALVEAIFSQAGYTLRSNFLQGLFFRSLYMSGAYASSDTTARRNAFDFLARRSKTAEAVANSSGRVYATPSMLLHTVGNLVDVLSPQAVDEAGNLLSDCFSQGGCLKMEEGRLVFRPTSKITVGFEYRIAYESSYRILSRKQLTGFDGIYLGENSDIRFQLANRFEDRRSALVAGQSYRAIRFGHQDGERNRLLVDGVEVARFDGRSAVVVMPESGDLTTLSWQMMPIGADYWVATTQDWALYDGHVEEEGTTEAEITLRTPPEEVGPTMPKFFDRIYFYGAEAGMTLRLLPTTLLRPYFSSRPAYGSTLGFSDMACHGITQAEFLAALCHLFNLRIFSDEELKQVYIEPESSFYEQEQVIDWRERQVKGTLCLSESDNRQHESRLYGYLQGDGLVERYDLEHGGRFGSLRVESPSLAAKQGCEALINPLFAPTLNESGHFANAPSASIPVVGNRDWSRSVEEPQFQPRILRYEGLKLLPAGERWGWPHGAGSYPLAAFHSPRTKGLGGYTLCFEDRDDEQGLFRYYKQHEELLARGQEVVLDLLLSADEVAALERWAEAGEVGCNALYRLSVEGEPVRCRLERIEYYRPAEGIARCCFTLLNDDRP